MCILNLTQHAASPEQIAQGVVGLEGDLKARAVAALTFDLLPTAEEVWARAAALADICEEVADNNHDLDKVMIGGAPYLMAPLEGLLQHRGFTPVYAFSQRESVEQVLPDGSTKKVAVFRHAGFIEGI